MIGFLMIVAALPMSRSLTSALCPSYRGLCAVSGGTLITPQCFSLGFPAVLWSGYRAFGHDSREARTARPRPSFVLVLVLVLFCPMERVPGFWARPPRTRSEPSGLPVFFCGFCVGYRVFLRFP